MENDALRQKLSKLLNMTTANGCTEDEQETAMRMAAGLAARAGIELDSVKPSGEATPKKRSAKSKTLSQEWKVHQVLAAQAAGALYGVAIYTYAGGKQGILFVGREELIESAEQTMFWLMRQVELLYKGHLPRGMTQRDRAEYRKTFKAACAHRVYERALSLMYQMKTNPAAAMQATGSNALVVTGYFETLRKEIDAYFGMSPEDTARRQAKEAERRAAMTPAQRAQEDKEIDRANAKAAKRKGLRPRTLPVGNGTSAGTRAGDSVRLRREIGS